MGLSMKELKQRAREYVEIEGHTKVLAVRFKRRFKLFGREDVALEVTTDEKDEPLWWVIGGTTPMNLYSAKAFQDVDVAYSLHIGLVLRMQDQQFSESDNAPADIGYDAFISHATEDKKTLVRPLAAALTRLRFRVWYDEFELKVGDSLRRSIDRGLANSRFGIVVLSKSFFAKNWPQYELNGLVAKEVDGKKVILPVWHGVTKTEVQGYSAPLADKVAIVTKKTTPAKIAAALAKVLSE